MLKLSALLAPLFLLPLAACSSSADDAGDGAESAATPAEQVAALRAHVTDLEAKPEHTEDRVRVQHILISFKGAPRMPPTVTRSMEEAEALAAKVYAEVLGGADFTRLMSENSDDDKVVGQYLMTASEPTVMPTLWNRKDMVPAFGNVGWRLEIGEVGVAPHHTSDSPFGWHIVKRLEL